MKRSTKIITAVALTLGVVGGATAYGKHQFGDPAKRAAYMVSHISEELKLDTTQEQALNVLKDEMMATKALMHDEVSPLREEVEALISADIFDQARALELISNKTATINEAAPTLIAAFGNFLDGLDADQKAEVLEFMDRRHDRGHRRHHGDRD